MHLVGIRHRFEAAHRLPQLAGKCANVHGHSWEVEVEIAAPDLDGAATVVEFGAVKGELRRWVDANLDHAAMLGVADPLITAFADLGLRVFVFGDPDVPAGEPESFVADVPWPTVEGTSLLLARLATDIVGNVATTRQTRVETVTVFETATNRASYRPVVP